MFCLIICIVGASIVLILTIADPDLLVRNIEDLPTIAQLQALAVNATAMAFAGLLILYYINHLFTNIHKNNALFTDGNVRDLKIIAILIFVSAIVLTAVTVLTLFFIENTENIVVGFNPMIMLATAFVVYIVSLIFGYGTELQRESDETL
jgi:hypothetical protein